MLLKKSKIDVKKDANELKTIRDLVRFGVSQFIQANVYFGHGTDNAWDEAVYLVLYALHLPQNVDRVVLDARLTTSEKTTFLKSNRWHRETMVSGSL